MYDHDIEAKLRSGGQMVTAGIVVLVVSFFGVCGAAASNANDPNSMAKGIELGQSPLLMLALTAGIALIAVGAARKSNARREAERRYLEHNTSVDLVPDQETPGGPYRGSMKEVEVLDPMVEATEEARLERDRRSGSTYLAFGGAIIAITIVIIVMVGAGGEQDSPRQRVQNILMALGLGVFPFGLGMFLAIKGLLLRSK